MRHELTIGGEKVVVETKRVLDYAIRHDRKKEVSSCKTVTPKKFIIKVPSYDLEYVNNTFKMFIEDFKTIAESLKEDVRSGRQTTMFDFF